MEEIIHFDKHLLLMLNGSDSAFFDSVIMTLTTAQTWIPLYIALLYVVTITSWHRNRPWDDERTWRTIRDVTAILLAAGLCVLLAGTVDDEIVKPLVSRWRPTHDPEIGHLVDTVNGYRGGNYGFFSAHAANTFSLAVFFSLLFRWSPLTCFLVCWSLTNCYTRLYLGVHYPGDIMAGLLWGGLVGWLVYRLYRRIAVPARYPSHTLLIPIATLCLTVAYALVRAALETS